MNVYNRYNCAILVGEFNISPDVHLQNANLHQAYLVCADLSRADLSGANLSGADLRYANLRNANLSGANLSGANLRSSHLNKANLSGANLSGADLFGADLYSANFKDAKLPKFQIPQRKSLIVFKKLLGNKIAKLQIPCRAKRTASLVGKKCRAERAIVLEIHAFDSSIKYQTAQSFHNPDFIYEVGKEVKPSNGYDGDIRVECLPGIHFFMTEDEARKYEFN